jgi:hypothetical protein
MRWPRLALAASLSLMSTSAMTQDWLRAFPDGVVAFGMAVVSFKAQDIISVDLEIRDSHVAVRVRFASDLEEAFSAASKGKSIDSTIVYYCGSPIPGETKLVELRGPELVFLSESMETAEKLAVFMMNLSCAKLTS